MPVPVPPRSPPAGAPRPGAYAGSVGFSIEKFLVIALIAAFLIGPERLPDYTTRLARFVRSARRMFDDAKTRVRDELGEDFDEEEWRRLDPRQYDPRRIIRDALTEPMEPREEPRPERTAEPRRNGDVGWDSEAT